MMNAREKSSALARAKLCVGAMVLGLLLGCSTTPVASEAPASTTPWHDSLLRPVDGQIGLLQNPAAPPPPNSVASHGNSSSDAEIPRDILGDPNTVLKTMAEIQRRGSFFPKDYWGAVDTYRVLGHSGDAEAMYQMAAAHALGRGADFDAALALDWAKKAAAENHLFATMAIRRSGGEPEELCRQLRQAEMMSSPEHIAPPLDSDLRQRINAALSLGKDGPFVCVYRSAPRYPRGLRLDGVSGRAVVHVDVGASGHPREIKITEASLPSFGEAARQCVARWRFIPPIKNGLPMTFSVIVPFEFTAEKLE